MRQEQIVILGNGGAAIFAAEAVRKQGYLGEIHMVSDVNEQPFNPMLSPYYFKGRIPWKGCFPFKTTFYRDYDISCHFGVPVKSLNAKNQQITLINGREITYDRCLIATGASPITPPIPGLRESPRVYPLRTAASTEKLENAMHSAKKAIVLGASLVGMEMAEILIKRGIYVVLLDVVDQVLPRGTHQKAAEMLKMYIEEQGVDVRLGCTMESVESVKDGVVCHFSGGIIEEADIIIVATGVRPNLEFLNCDEIEVKQGVIVDDHMRTNADNLFAAGDASQAMNHVSGTYDWLGTWGSACYQGRVAGRNMAGKAAVFKGTLLENISPFFEWTFAQIGDMRPQGENAFHLDFGDPREGGFCMMAFQGDLLTGVNLINCTDLSGRFRNAILRKWRCKKISYRGGEQYSNSSLKRIVDRCIKSPFTTSCHLC